MKVKGTQSSFLSKTRPLIILLLLQKTIASIGTGNQGVSNKLHGMWRGES